MCEKTIKKTSTSVDLKLFNCDPRTNTGPHYRSKEKYIEKRMFENFLLMNYNVTFTNFTLKPSSYLYILKSKKKLIQKLL